MLQMVIDYIGDRRVPLILVAAVLAGGMGVHEWMDVHYMPHAQAQEADKELAAQIGVVMEQVTKNTTAIEEHNIDYAKNENKKAIGVVQDQQFALVQYEKANGSTEITIARAEELRRKLIDLQDRKICLQAGTCK